MHRALGVETAAMEDSRSPPQTKAEDAGSRNGLEVTIISAQGLKDLSRMFFRMSPYALAWIDPEDKYCTPVAHNAGTNPTWNHKLYVPLPGALAAGTAAAGEAELFISIYNRVSREDPLLGNAKIPLRDVKKELQYMACQLQRASGRIHGLLNISVRTCRCDHDLVENSSFKRVLETCKSFKVQKTPPSSDDDEEERRERRDETSSSNDAEQQGDLDEERRHHHDLLRQLKLEERFMQQPTPSTSCAATPCNRPRLTAPDILDLGQVEDPNNPQQQQQHQNQHQHQQQQQQQQQRGGGYSGGQQPEGGGHHGHQGSDGRGDGGSGDLATYYLGSQASAAMDSLAHW